MERLRRRIVAVLLVLASFPAYASGVYGLMTFLIGLPLLIMMCAALIWLLRGPRSAFVRYAVLLLLAGSFLYVLYLVPDAISTFRLGLRGDATIGIIFFALTATVAVLAYKVVCQVTTTIVRSLKKRADEGSDPVS